MARIYHRDQAGAPALTYSNTSTAQAHFDAFRTVLKACLVSGYGAIPGAGWELVHDAANSLVLRNGSHSGYVCFQRDASALSLVRVWLAATYTGVDASGKIIGDGVRSGVAANSAVPQCVTVRSFAQNSASTTWALVADERSFCLSPSASTSSSPPEVTGTQGNSYDACSPLYCGDDSAGDFICVGGINSATATASTSICNFYADGFTALKFPHSGLLVDASAISVAMPGCLVTGGTPGYLQVPSGLVFPDLQLTSPAWAANGVVRRLRGLAFDPRLLTIYNSQFSQALGGPVLTTRNMNTVLSLGDGFGYLIARTYYVSCVSLLLTDNPEFWP